jgi:hypothetical protein
MCENEINCLSCSNSTFLSRTNETNSECVVECPSYYFADVEQSKCLICTNNCIACSDQFNCTDCDPGYTTSHGVCLLEGDLFWFGLNVNSCFDGWVATDQVCLQCASLCNSCVDTVSCATCADNSTWVEEDLACKCLGGNTF